MFCGISVVRLPVERVADQRLRLAVAVLVLVVGRRVRHERTLAHDPERLVEVALVPARRDLAVDRHLRVGVHLRQHLVVNRVRDQRHTGEARPAEAPHAGRVVLDPDALRHRQDAAVVTLHSVREAPVGGVVILVALGGVRVGEVNQIERAVASVRARLRVERLPARAGDLARRVRQVQLVHAIGRSDPELRASIACPIHDVALPQVELHSGAHVEQGELDGCPVQVHVVGEVAHHAVGVPKRERGVVGLVAHPLRDAIEVDKPRLVELPADRATPVGEIDREIADLERNDLDQRDELLDLREQSGREARRREPGDRRVERVGRRCGRDLDQRDAHRASPLRDHIPGERLVGEAAGERRRPVAVVVGRVVSERAVRAVLGLPKVPERDPLGVVHPGAPHGKPPRAGAQQEPLLDLRVARAELVDGHVRMVRAPVRVLGHDGERAGGCDLRNADVADGVRHL